MKTIYSAECQKLSSGILNYEVGIDKGEYFVKVAENPGGGRFSDEWVPVKKIEDVLEKAGPSFSSIIFREVFVSKSTNNAGFLAAILKAEKVVGPAADNPKKLTFLSFAGFAKKKRSQKTGGGPGQQEADASK